MYYFPICPSNFHPIFYLNPCFIPQVVRVAVSKLRRVQLSLVQPVVRPWLVAAEATYGNPQNSYSANYTPVHNDYIFHRANNNNTMWTDWFNVSCRDNK